MHEAPTLPAQPRAIASPVTIADERRQTPPRQRPQRATRSLKRRLLGLVVYACYLLIIVELVCRGYWWKRWGVPFLHMDQIWAGRFYPELVESGLATASIPRGDATFDILLLGGSVLHVKHGNIAALLEEKLNAAQSRPVKIWNCSARALTSRDCLLKYERLGDQHFDLVVFYEAINETRMNNCPHEMFRADLTHCSWYKRLDSFQKHREINWLASPFTIQDTIIGALDSPSLMWYLPREHPPEGAWSEAGRDIKTAVSFRNSLTGLVNLAHERGEPLLLLGYAVHIPPDYTRAKFIRHELSYGAHFGPAECWGLPDAVRAGVAAENAVTRDLVAKHPSVHYVDLDAAIPKDGAHFDDPCHLTAAGCAAWVDGVLPTIREVMVASPSGTAASAN
ncbi:MAG: hypothetical protein K2Y37_20415 [Pirellulales bacterium]|nr:hypothetical protein [Pirellulales bacterium]